ncbi:cation-translocating P-type ATPase [Janthinobacterium sp.]|uniref:cation-translocating P-type ATPase n=1 Tax=Janthinobacterium sp. TaxID=1871054 RepID=UPI002DB7AD31|nr:cation-translocating P-type ATPase [Janthinobacterium sp.]HEU4818439.1 cation-translocating P-type ATPase [Janthinobacterium sp.]
MPPQRPQSSGWTTAEAAARLAADGPNELPAARPLGYWRLLAEIVREPMFLLLLACGAIYLLLGDRQEAAMLLGFVVLVIGISYVQRQRTERSLSALRDLSSPRALVIRDGCQARIAGRELVRGDLVLLAEGDRVPADIALLTASNLMADESMLTGESVPVVKLVPDCVYAGTLITQGTASGSVTATGAHSALGRIGAALAAQGGELTPVQQETRRVVRAVAIGALGLAAALGLAYWWLRGDALRGLLAGLTLAMALLPEELPVILTLFLGLGAWRLGREQVLARSMPAIELLGATTVLCVDKTGTLTSNRMQLRRLWSEEAAYACGQAPEPPLPEALHGLLEYAVLASHRQAFDPMEAAIGTAGARLLANTEHLHGDWMLVDDYPLSRQMLAMSRVWRSPSRQDYVIAAKGAPEAIMDLCHLAPAHGARIAAQVAVLADSGMRVIGVACATFAAPSLPSDQHDFDFAFLGLLALEDPVRAEVPAAVAQCREAGIRVVMITGDHPATALSIARQAGIAMDGAPLTGGELDGMDDAALQERLAGASVCCRIAPAQKLRLVRALRARGDIVAMTGDGVNDAPALKAAHIGVAMGARGTDVAREAAALVLLKDDFSSLVVAVRHGRRLFANLRKAIVFIVAVHVPIAGLSILPVLLGWPLLLLPVHVLFLQLIIDPACSIVFEAEPMEAGTMRQPPRPTARRLFDSAIVLRGVLQGAGLLALLLALFSSVRGAGQSEEATRAAVFIALTLSNLVLIHVNRRPAGVDRTRPDGRNPYAGSIAAAAVLLLLLVLGTPALRRLFAFAVPDAASLLLSCLVALATLAWCALLRHLQASMRLGAR